MTYDATPRKAPALDGQDVKRLGFQRHRRERGDFAEDLGSSDARLVVQGSPWPPRRRLLVGDGFHE